MEDKPRLRAELRALRRAHVASLPPATRGLLFRRPPAALAGLAPPGAIVGVYQASASEAPAGGYARWFHENGRPVALPWFADRGAPMRFRLLADPFAADTLDRGPFGHGQPPADAPMVTPALLIVPLIAFTAQGHRLGQGGGHYDRWLAAHSDTPAIGLAWDCQRVEELPVEPHDRPLRAVVTPTRFYEGQA